MGGQAEPFENSPRGAGLRKVEEHSVENICLYLFGFVHPAVNMHLYSKTVIKPSTIIFGICQMDLTWCLPVATTSKRFFFYTCPLRGWTVVFAAAAAEHKFITNR